MSKALTEDIKDRLKNLQQQKNLLQEELEYAKSSKKAEQIEQDIYEVLTLQGSIASRDHLGGTAPTQVRAAIARARLQI